MIALGLSRWGLNAALTASQPFLATFDPCLRAVSTILRPFLALSNVPPVPLPSWQYPGDVDVMAVLRENRDLKQRVQNTEALYQSNIAVTEELLRTQDALTEERDDSDSDSLSDEE